MLPSSHLAIYSLFTSGILSFFSGAIAQTPDNTTTLPVGSCTATIPCSNGACCNSESGFCGFGDKFCTTVANGGPCTSNCDALAECGQGSAPVNFTCPLNVCCSQFGFCGTTTEFCEPGCQSNCDPPSMQSCGDDQASALHRRIGYYEGWAMSADSRACDMYPPSSISAETLTHVNYAFALISEEFQIMEMAVNDNVLWLQTTALKKRNPALKVFLSIGGWSFNDPPTQHIFSNMVGSADATNTFIASALSIMQAYSFDGLDIDWEYPVAPERGGVPADKANYPVFMSKLKAAFKPRGYELSFTAPSSYWYLQHFDLPALLQSADWVNVMTYDLHGVWDGTDPYIGPVINAHTNLTEIKSTMQLLRNIGVDPSQIVLGIGFYGRSFQLADPTCSEPNCPFVGGGDPGVCSLNSGTLMFSEIEQIIDNDNLVPVFDDVDAVKYITWNEDQWVSYDDAQTLKMKLDYANSICLGGTMIWSVDQDDSQYTALSGLYGNVTAPSLSETGNQCQITGCGQQCPNGYDSLTTLTQIPNVAGSCDPKSPARLCCPPGNEPQNCQWRGGGGTTCNAQCNVGEIVMALDEVGDDGHPTCVQGYKAFCCQSGEPNPGACFGTSCSGDSCVAGYTAQTHVKQGSADNGISCEQSPQANNVCPEICQSNTKTVCCLEGAGYTNCEWVGDPPNCLNAACQAGQVSIFSDMQGDASTSCVGNNKRYYCCDPPSTSQFLPVPENWVFPQTFENSDTYDVDQPATFTADFDDNTGTSDSSSTGSGSSGIGDDGTENDSAFGEVFISSPNPSSVSSLDIQSDWVITGCDATSDQPQEALAYCSKGLNDEDSGCSHVLLGQAEHTIVRMPKSCGVGPYARVASLEIHPDQDILPTEHKARKRSTENVYSLKFDYNFLAIPESNGPVLMRADMTDIPGYWDEMVNSAPDSGTTDTRRRKRDYHQPSEYEKRWFGPFDDWLAKLTTVRSRNSIDRNFHWSDTYTIYHAEEQCPNFSSSLDISVTGSTSITSSFGYYLEASIVPPEVQECYIFFQAGAQAQASFTIKGLAEAHFDSSRSELASFGFPGLYYPGLLTLGPSLHLYGQLSGQLSLSGQITTSVGYTFPSIDISFGKKDSNNDEENESGPADPDANNQGYDFNVGYNVNLEGSLDAHIVPSLQIGVSVLGGTLIDAQLFTEADIYGGVSITGSVSQSSAAQFCVNPHFGVALNAGLTGSVLFWRANPLSWTFYNNEFPFGGSCFSSVDQPAAGNSKRDEDHPHYSYEAVGTAGHGVTIDTRHALDSPAYVAYEHTSSKSRLRGVQIPTSAVVTSANETSVHHKRAGVPFLPGNLFCPAVGSDILDTPSGSKTCQIYASLESGNTGQTADALNRRDEDINDIPLATERDNIPVLNGRANFMDGFHPLILAESTLKVCGSAEDPASQINIPIAAYTKTQVQAYFDLAHPGELDAEYGRYNPLPINTGTTKDGLPALSQANSNAIYAREHVYEQSMSALFVDYLAQYPALWDNTAGNKEYCGWVMENLVNPTTYYPGVPVNPAPTVFNEIGQCYPGGNQGGNAMVVLEQQSNAFKNTLMYDGERRLNNLGAQVLMDSTKFSGYCAETQVAKLRAAAGVASYMNDYTVQQNFLLNNACIRDIWKDWSAKYLTSNVDAPNKATVNVPNLYDNWISTVVTGMVPFLRSEITRLIPLYNDGLTTAADIDLSFAVLLDNDNILNRNGQPMDTGGAAFTIDRPTTQQELIDNILNDIPDITWASTLPRH